MKLKKILGSILFTIALLLLWQLLYTACVDWFSFAKSYAVPSPAGVWDSFLRLLMDGTLFFAIGNSLLRVLAGFAIAIVIGAILSILIIQSRFLETNLKPVLLGIQTLPSICWVPFAILWFGLNESAIIFVVIMGSAFGIAIGIENAVKNVPPYYIKVAQTMGITKRLLYTKVIFPAIFPSLIGTLKQGWSFAWRALMSGEVMSATAGLGYTLMIGRDLADINQVMTVMLVIILLGILIDKGIFSTWERYLLSKRGL